MISTEIPANFTVIVHNEPVQASDRHPQGCPVQRPQDDGGLHVLRRGQRVDRTAAADPQDRRDVEDQRSGRDAGRGVGHEVRQQVERPHRRKSVDQRCRVDVGQYGISATAAAATTTAAAATSRSATATISHHSPYALTVKHVARDPPKTAPQNVDRLGIDKHPVSRLDRAHSRGASTAASSATTDDD